MSKFPNSMSSICAKQSVRRTDLVLAAVLIIGCLAAYMPAMRAGFIWDDDAYVTKNSLLTAPDGLRRIWFSTDQPSQYFPLVYTTFRIERSIWGLNPAGYHITNILLHIANAILVWILLRRLIVPGAWLAAAIFALHPVNVESVAWITELKNILMMFFFLLSLLAFIRFIDEEKTQRARLFYVLSLLFLSLSLFSKTTACTMPAAAVLVLRIKRIPLKARRWLQIAPYILLSLAMGILTVWWELTHQNTGRLALGLNPVNRMLLASRALLFYAGKLFLPLNLTFSYPKWTIDETNPISYVWLLVCLAAALCVWRYADSLGRKAVAAIIFFPAMLFPMLGFFSLYTFRYTYVADHYQYLAGIGLITLAVGAGCHLANRFGRLGQNMGLVAAVLILGVLGILTWQQSHIYKDPETLWLDTLKKNPDSYLAHNNLGLLLKDKGKIDGAFSHYYEALRIEPEFAEAHNNLAKLFREQGKLEEAEAHLRRAIETDPGYSITYFNLGILLQQQGKLDEAINQYQKALQGTDLLGAHMNLAVILGQRGKYEEATKQFNEVLRINPDSSAGYYNWGLMLKQQGKIDEAVEKWKKALELNPGLTGAQHNLALALEKKNKK
jgi:tetratricopeptide (TPR) repeat protein